MPLPPGGASLARLAVVSVPPGVPGQRRPAPHAAPRGRPSAGGKAARPYLCPRGPPGPVTSGAVPPRRAPGLCSRATQNAAGPPRLSPWGLGAGAFLDVPVAGPRVSGCTAGPPVRRTPGWCAQGFLKGWRWKDFGPLRPTRASTRYPLPRPQRSLLMEGVQGHRGEGA